MDLVRLFFSPVGNDVRGEQFMHLAYNGMEYSKAINAENPETLVNEPLLQLMLEQNYQGGGDAETVSVNFTNFILDVARHHRNLDDGESIGANATSAKRKVFDSVYKADNVPLQVMKFFTTFLHVVDTTSNQPVDFKTADPTRVRFNFAKKSVGSGDADTELFAETLPLLCSCVKKMIVSKNSGTTLNTITNVSVDTNARSLRDLYIDAKKSIIDGTVKSYLYNATTQNWYDLNKTADTYFKLDVPTFIKNSILARDKPVKSSPSATPAETNFDDLYESVVTGVRYIRKNGTLVKLNEDGSTGKEYKDSELNIALTQGAPNCATTGIDVSNCTIVSECLLSGKPETLSVCLAKLKEKDMFEVARKEVNNMHPQVAVQLLRTFGFKPRKEAGSNTLLPPTFDEWKRKLSRTVDATTASTILANSQLMKYLQAIVSIVRSNPAIINTNIQSGLTSDFARKSGLTVFRNPFPERSTSADVVDGLVFTQNQMIPQVPLALRIANISSRMPVPLNLVGGGEDACVNSAQIGKAFKLIFAEMEKNGKVLVESDKARIHASVEKLGKLESQLIKLMEDAKLFAKLNSALNPGQSTSDTVTLKDISNVRDNLSSDTLTNLNDCINKNISDQSQLSSDLVNKVQMPLLELLLGRTNPLLNQL